MSFPEALYEAASACGIATEYWDIWGQRHQARPETLQAILSAMGVPCDSAEALDAALQTRLWEEC